MGSAKTPQNVRAFVCLVIHKNVNADALQLGSLKPLAEIDAFPWKMGAYQPPFSPLPFSAKVKADTVIFSRNSAKNS